MTSAHPSGADVVVVGGGIAGVSAAYELAGSARVVLVDMERGLAHHATGRSAATLATSYGPPIVRRATAAALETLLDPPDPFDAPLLHRRPTVWFAGPDDRARVDERLAALTDVASVTRMSADDVLATWPVLRAEAIDTAILDSGSYDIDVHALHSGYVRGLRGRGGAVLTEWHLAGARRRGGAWELTSRSGEHITARSVVLACSAWADVVAAVCGVPPIGAEPRRRTAFHAPSPTVTPQADWPLFADIGGRFYVKPEGDRYLISPIDHEPSEPCDARPDELAIARALDDLSELTTLEIRHVSSAWAGLQSVTGDGLPIVGEDPTAAGLFWLVGQAGHGIQTAPTFARVTAALVTASATVPALSPGELAAVAPRRNAEADERA